MLGRRPPNLKTIPRSPRRHCSGAATRRDKGDRSSDGETFSQAMRCGGTNEGVASMTNANTESLVVEFKKEVAKMREREATDLEIQSMLEFVEQLTHWKGDVDREPLIKRSGPYIGAHFIFRVGALRGDRLPCRGSSHTSDPPRSSSHFCIHPAHGRGSHFGTGIDLGASRTSLFGSTDLLSGRMPSSRASLNPARSSF
jgi:hypothetical protein